MGARKTRILDVVYNATNNELVRTKTLVKGCIVQIESAPFNAWYYKHYGVSLGKPQKMSVTYKGKALVVQRRKLRFRKELKAAHLKRRRVALLKIEARKKKREARKAAWAKSHPDKKASKEKMVPKRKLAKLTPEAKKKAQLALKRKTHNKIRKLKKAKKPVPVELRMASRHKKPLEKSDKKSSDKKSSSKKKSKKQSKKVDKRKKRKSVKKSSTKKTKTSRQLGGRKRKRAAHRKRDLADIKSKKVGSQLCRIARPRKGKQHTKKGIPKSLQKKWLKRGKERKLEDALVTQCQTGKLLAKICSRPGQCGRADGYILEGAELEFYAKKLDKKKKR
eukprot:NODE_1320_length_1193_cov_206.255245_g1040_i1.p1 GENE.NODE_1320_length_1193_cov_206.255245_g1040_i1~~NODE_1320_length_1193_cov_206.255245_g1040_i1.p1  ORF type:complete len:343 (-),score=87.49 NODE_1320_length_1193_cov_206.255245_g1040_i1:163-1167(-)